MNVTYLPDGAEPVQISVPGVVVDTLDSLTEERDRARRIAVRLEQENAELLPQVGKRGRRIRAGAGRRRDGTGHGALEALHAPASEGSSFCRICCTADDEAWPEEYPCPTLRLVQP